VLDFPKKPYEVFLRKDSPNFWMRFSLPGHGQKRIGLKTADRAEADRKAEQEYQRAVWSAEKGILEGKTSFDKIARQYLAHLEALGLTSSRHKKLAIADRGVIDRYLIPYFGRATVTSINQKKLNEYLDWRKAYWTSGPGVSITHIEYQRAGKIYRRPAVKTEPALSTLRREAVTLRAVFKHAARLGHMTRAEIPAMELATERRNKRPSFTDAEIETLTALAEKRIMEVGVNAARNRAIAMNRWKDWQEVDDFDNRIRYERLVLLCFINIAVATGMRPTELHNLSWENIVGFEKERKKPIGKGRIRIQAFGKGRNPQVLVPNVEAFGNFITLWDSFRTLHGRDPELRNAVFCNAAGERAGSYKKSLNALLEAAGLKFDAFGRPRSAYSFRHTYATNQLRKGTDVYTLAINMRTSVRMIEMYYSDVVPDDVAKRLEGDFA
jgi:integrase